MTAATQSLSATAWKQANFVPNMGEGGGLHVYEIPAVTVATTAIDEQDDIFEIGYIPAGIRVHGFIVSATDMDTHGTAALVYKLRIAGTDVVTGVTIGQSAATDAFYLGSPVTTTALSVVDAKVTTAAATAAQGTVKVRVLYTAA
jgi:hypothetical protein